MNVSPSGEPGFNASKPPEWDEVLDFAEQNLRPGVSLGDQKETASKVWDRLEMIDVEEQEKLRNFGLGLLTCKFMRHVMTDVGRDTFVDNATSAAISTHLRRAPDLGLKTGKGLSLLEVSSHPFQSFSRDWIRPTADTHPDNQRLVLNTLMVFARIKPWQRASRKDTYMSRTPYGDGAIDSIVTNTLAGAAMTARIALIHLYERQTGKRYPKEYSLNPQLRKFTDADTIRSLNIGTAARVAARLRLDELGLPTFRNYTRLDDNNVLHANREAIPKDPPRLPHDTPIVHHNRQKCPAAFVEAAIPFVAGVTPEIIAQAQERTTSPARKPKFFGPFSFK